MQNWAGNKWYVFVSYLISTNTCRRITEKFKRMHDKKLKNHKNGPYILKTIDFKNSRLHFLIVKHINGPYTMFIRLLDNDFLSQSYLEEFEGKIIVYPNLAPKLGNDFFY